MQCPGRVHFPGFNPDIRYEVPQTLHTHDHCVQIVRNAGLTPEMKIEKNICPE